MAVSRKKHDTTPVAEAAELAHGLLGEDDAKPVSETRADWIEVLADTPAPDSRHIFTPDPSDPYARPGALKRM
jgi:hypothetical protein